MKNARPTDGLMPPLLVLGMAAASTWLNPAGIATMLGGRLFAVWQSVAPGGAPLVRPELALPAETALLLASGGLVILMIQRLRLYWAGFFVVVALAAGFEASWFAFAGHHWLIDAATPGAALSLVFLTGAVTRISQTRLMRTRLRIAFSDSLPQAAIEKIARRPEILSIDGETKPVTYLVCGIRGLAALAAEYRGRPRDFTQLMNDVLSPLLDQARLHGGTIDRLTADGFAAFWNAPLDDPEHALRACEAAHGMTQIAARGESGKPPPDIGIGIATGPVIAGGFGGLGRLGYSVNGDAVVLAARLQALSPQYGPALIVDEETRHAAERAFAFLEVDYIAAGSDDAPVRLYALQGAMRASPKFRALKTFHEHLFASLRSQQWGKARDMIEQCRKLSGASQTLYDLHLARIKYFERNPPGPEWDGAFRPILK